MEQWETIIENPIEQSHRSFEKILETASTLLNSASTQLAPFETEWLTETLLFAPVELLATVTRRRGEDLWRKAVADALKLLPHILLASHKHAEQIVDVCLLSYEPELRALALTCLAAVARLGAPGAAAARDVTRHVRALEEAGQCRTPLALLIGALCEHHPAAVCEQVTRIWRALLNILGNNRNTDNVNKAALQGVRGLLTHFGDELPCAELNLFYDEMARLLRDNAACQTACYSILSSHAGLFKERVAAAFPLRVSLWGAAPTDALLGVYAATAQCVTKPDLIKILTTEVLPHTQSPSHQTKLAALRVLAATNTGSFGDLTEYVDIHTLEYELRREKVSYSDAEHVLFCVEYGLPDSERLLQAAILFYDNLPAAVRKKIVVSGVLKSPPELKRAAIQFLIATSCEDEEALVWRDLLHDDAAATVVVRELTDCLLITQDAIGEDVSEPPPLLCALLRLAALVPPAHAALLRRHFYKAIRSGSGDAATLAAARRALEHTPDTRTDIHDTVYALQVVLSSDVAPQTQGAALRKLGGLLAGGSCSDNDKRDALAAAARLHARGAGGDKDSRELHRDLTLFLGKYGHVDLNNNRDSWDDELVVDMKKSLALSLPYQGTTYKVDLKSMLLLAVQNEDPSALQTFLAILCANVLSNKELNTQRAMVRVLSALAHARGEHATRVLRAGRLCEGEASVDLLYYISSSKSKEARRLLAAALCADDAILRRAAERAAVILASDLSTTKQAGLDVAEAILTSLEHNHSLTAELLPQLTTLVARTYQTDTKTTFNIASKALIDKKQLFDKETIRKTIENLLENILKASLDDTKIYKDTVNMTIEFARDIQDVKLDEILDMIFDITKHDVNVKLLYVLAVLKSTFDIDAELSRRILGRYNSAVLTYLLNLSFSRSETEFFKVEAVLRFLEEYCEVILELKYKGNHIKLLFSEQQTLIRKMPFSGQPQSN